MSINIETVYEYSQPLKHMPILSNYNLSEKLFLIFRWYNYFIGDLSHQHDDASVLIIETNDTH